MFKQALMVVSLSFSISTATNAAVSHNGSTLNEATNIVTGGGLETLQWGGDENTTQTIFFPDAPGTNDSAANMFIDIYGDTFQTSGEVCCGAAGSQEMSRSLFGLDSDVDGFFNLATVTDEYEESTGNHVTGEAQMHIDAFPPTTPLNSAGIALVRDDVTRVSIPSPPAAGWLFFTSLAGLAGLILTARS